MKTLIALLAMACAATGDIFLVLPAAGAAYFYYEQ